MLTIPFRTEILLMTTGLTALPLGRRWQRLPLPKKCPMAVLLPLMSVIITLLPLVQGARLMTIALLLRTVVPTTDLFSIPRVKSPLLRVPAAGKDTQFATPLTVATGIFVAIALTIGIWAFTLFESPTVWPRPVFRPLRSFVLISPLTEWRIAEAEDTFTLWYTLSMAGV